MKNKKILYILLIAILIIGIIALPAFADAGHFSGHSNFGGGSRGSSFGSSGSSSGSGLFGLMALGSMGGGAGSLIFIIIIIFIVMNIVRNRQGSVPISPNHFNSSDLMPMQTLQNIDPNFSQERIKEKISNLYVQMQDAWQNKSFESMRPYMTDTLYSQFSMQLDELVRAGYTNYIDRIAVLDVSLSGWKTDAVNDSIVAKVNTRIIDYTVDDKTGKVIEGSQKIEKFMCYEWTLIRSKGQTTAAEPDKEKTSTFHCPSCGAPIEMNQSAKCPYCGSVISSTDFDWTISSIKGISQRSGY